MAAITDEKITGRNDGRQDTRTEKDDRIRNTYEKKTRKTQYWGRALVLAIWRKKDTQSKKNRCKEWRTSVRDQQLDRQ